MDTKRLFSYRLYEETNRKIEEEAKLQNKGKTEIIEEALNFYFKEMDEERLATILLDKIEEKYVKKLNLRLRAMDVNIEVIMQILNTMAHSLKDKNAINDFISIEDFESPIIEKARLAVDKKIAHAKQRKDYDKKGE